MPRKKQTDKTRLDKPTTADMMDISESKDALSASESSREEAEAIPFAEIVAETGSNDEKAAAPHFPEAEVDAALISAPTPDSDALDKAIQEARDHGRPAQDEPAHSPVIAYEQPALLAIPRRQAFPAELISPPPPVVLATVGLMLIFLLALD